MKRRDGYKMRSGDSAFVDKEAEYAKMLNELRPKAIEADPLGSFQSMETMLGNQRMEMHRLIHGFHDMAMRFLVRKEQSWRKAELDRQAVGAELEALKNSPLRSQSKASNKGNKDGSSNVVLLAQLERCREQLLDSERSLRDVQAENFELREQLAAIQAVGAGYGSILSPTSSKDVRWMPPAEPEVSDTKDSVAQFLEKLGCTSSNPLDRLERAQSKLEAWANSHHPKPDPVLAGLVDYQNMDLPNFVEEPDPATTAVAVAVPEQEETEAVEETEGFSYVRSAKNKRKSVKGGGRQTFSMKDKVQDIFAAQMSTRDKYKKSGVAQKIVRSTHFENLCMFVIFLNAIWIGIDMSLNDAEVLAYADAPFVVVENLFCCFFFFEILVRLLAFDRTWGAFKDRWFLFDFALVVLMVTETWIMFLIVRISTDPTQTQEQAFDSSVLRLLKLVRITRVARIARLLRQVPEVMILLKGIGVASRSVMFTCLILLCVIYIFAIALTQLSEDTPLGQAYFPTLADGMFSLLFHGCFFQGLPDFARLCFKENVMYGFSLLFFVVLAPLTVMNMIVGVLVEVVGIVAAAEQDAATKKSLLESLREALNKLDLHMINTITKAEFGKVVNRPDIVSIFLEAGIDIVALLRDPDIVFAGDSDMNLEEFLEEIITLRGANVATVKDLGQLKDSTGIEATARQSLVSWELGAELLSRFPLLKLKKAGLGHACAWAPGPLGCVDGACWHQEEEKRREDAFQGGVTHLISAQQRVHRLRLRLPGEEGDRRGLTLLVEELHQRLQVLETASQRYGERLKKHLEQLKGERCKNSNVAVDDLGKEVLSAEKRRAATLKALTREVQQRTAEYEDTRLEQQTPKVDDEVISELYPENDADEDNAETNAPAPEHAEKEQLEAQAAENLTDVQKENHTTNRTAQEAVQKELKAVQLVGSSKSIGDEQVFNESNTSNASEVLNSSNDTEVNDTNESNFSAAVFEQAHALVNVSAVSEASEDYHQQVHHFATRFTLGSPLVVCFRTFSSWANWIDAVLRTSRTLPSPTTPCASP
ncbi:unnamed protein product [Durusdinium trenchii]|uniref:Ion transport domain-containing protein n=1 Tax=Durusdinium trenchii TaxID=1381693 RepID=A0ABP0IG92_9DINO